jgi:hypothetical protein
MDRRAFAKDLVARYRDEMIQVMTDLLRIPSEVAHPFRKQASNRI